MGKWTFKTTTAVKRSVLEKEDKNKWLDRVKKEMGEGKWKIEEEWGRKSTKIQKQKQCEGYGRGVYGTGKESGW